ncbi:MAG: AraC family transcriptional regulator [Clostridiaceae bacterium]|nr:AraC family transcriptional regulator [Clostridiaceae bacterium]
MDIEFKKRPMYSFESHEDIEIVWNKRYQEEDVRFISLYNAWSLNWHSQFEFKRYYSGKAAIVCGAETYEVGEGDIVVVNPMEMHTQIYISGTLHYDLVFVNPRILTSYIADGEDGADVLSRMRFHTVLRNNPRAFDLLGRFLEEYWNKDDAYEMAAEGILRELFTHLIRTELHDSVSQEDYEFMFGNARRVAPAMRYIIRYYYDPININELAAMCGMTPYHFCRVFHRMIGSSPMQYVMKHRMQQARRCLLSTKMTLDEIAESVGYTDEGYFCRLFKKTYGITPSALRKGVDTALHTILPQNALNKTK